MTPIPAPSMGSLNRKTLRRGSRTSEVTAMMRFSHSGGETFALEVFMRHRYSYLIALLLTLVLAACGGQTAGDVSGTWNGTIANTGAPIVLQLTQSGTSLSGTLSLAATTGIPVTGTAADNLVSLSYQDTSLSLQIAASVNGSSMQGTITATDTEGTFSSSFTASK